MNKMINEILITNKIMKISCIYHLLAENFICGFVSFKTKKTKEFINKPIIRDYPTEKEYKDSVKSGTSSKYESIEYEKSDWRDDLGEDWQKTNRQYKTDGMSQKAVNAYKRENPGSKLKTAVTQKPSTLKRGSKKAKRRKSFCSRMKGMKKRLNSAKTARDPDSRINKALRRWNC